MCREGRKVFISDLVFLFFTVNLCRLLGRTRRHTALHFWWDGRWRSSLTLGSRNAGFVPKPLVLAWWTRAALLTHQAWGLLETAARVGYFWGFADMQSCMYVTVHRLGISPGENSQSSRRGQYRHSVHDISSCKDKSIHLLVPFKTLRGTRLYSFKINRALLAGPHRLCCPPQPTNDALTG